MATPLHVACYRDLKAWAKKHKRKLWVAAGLAGAGVGSYYFVSWLQASARAREEEEAAQAAQLRKESDHRTEAQLQSHFDSIQRISDSVTLPSVLPQVRGRLFELVNLSYVTDKLKSGKDDPQALTSKEKLHLWQELKILSFTRTVCAMCSLTLLDLFIRAQLNILGRHMYYEAARDFWVSRFREQEEDRASLSNFQHQFVTLADFLSVKGVDILVRDVREAVDAVLKTTPLKDPYTISKLKDAFEKIFHTFYKGHKSWVQYVLPPEDDSPPVTAAEALAPLETRQPPAPATNSEEDFASDEEVKLRELTSEMRNIVMSNEFGDVVGASLHAVLEAVLEDLSVMYGSDPDSGIPLAKLLPPVASAGGMLMDQPDKNKFLKSFSHMPQLRGEFERTTSYVIELNTSYFISQNICGLFGQRLSKPSRLLVKLGLTGKALDLALNQLLAHPTTSVALKNLLRHLGQDVRMVLLTHLHNVASDIVGRDV